MTPTAVGGTIELGAAPSVLPLAGGAHARLRYGAYISEGPRYRVSVALPKLSAQVSRTEKGFVATCVELGSLGYGPDEESALADLTEATRDYLMILKEDDPRLAPSVSHHSLYVALLNVPQASWFVSVVSASDPGQDAP